MCVTDPQGFGAVPCRRLLSPSPGGLRHPHRARHTICHGGGTKSADSSTCLTTTISLPLPQPPEHHEVENLLEEEERGEESRTWRTAVTFASQRSSECHRSRDCWRRAARGQVVEPGGNVILQMHVGAEALMKPCLVCYHWIQSKFIQMFREVTANLPCPLSCIHFITHDKTFYSRMENSLQVGLVRRKVSCIQAYLYLKYIEIMHLANIMKVCHWNAIIPIRKNGSSLNKNL